MSLHKEISFEVEICEHLAAHGWLFVDKNAVETLRVLALFPQNVEVRRTANIEGL